MSGSGGDLRALRIIGIGLITGPAILLAVTIFLRSDPERTPPERPEAVAVTWASLFVGVAVIAGSLVVPRPKGSDPVTIRAHFILRLAMVEAGALLGAVAYLLEGEPWAIGASALCLAVMATLHFPTQERVERLGASRP